MLNKDMDLLLQYILALGSTSLVLFALAIFVYIRNPKNKINWTFSLYSLAIAAWSGCEAYSIAAPTQEIGLLFWRLNHAAVIFIPVFFIHFVTDLLGQERKNHKILLLSYLVGIIFLIFDTSPLLIKTVIPKFSFKHMVVPGPFYLLFFILWMSGITFGLFKLFAVYSKSTGARRNQLKYLCWTSLIGYLGGPLNFLPAFNIEIFPFMPFGTYGVPIYGLVIAYAIMKYRLLEVNVALTRVGILALVYILVLGVPFAIAGLGKSFLINLFGNNWFWFPLVIFFILATAGPFLVIYFMRRTEDALFKERRLYQETINNLSESMIDIRDIDKLFSTITSTITEAIKIKFAVIYLKQEDYKSFQLKSYYPKETKSQFQEFIPSGDPFIDILNQRKKPLLSEEVGHQEKINLDSGVVIPCFGKYGLIGFIVLGAKQNHQMYTNDDLSVLETLSYNTSSTIENCIYWHEIEEHERQKRLAEMDLFTYSIAHEIDNPLTGIKEVALYLRDFFMKELNLTEAQKKEMESCLNAALRDQDRISTLMKAVGEFGKPGEFGPLRLEDTINTFLEFFRPEFKHKSILFTQEMPDKPIPYLYGSKQELMQVFVNLSNNSIHALLGVAQGEQKRIHLKVEVFDDVGVIRIIFKDNGYGIVKEKLSAIFAPLTTTKASTEGKGIGLTTCRKIIEERHKGKIWAESEGKGKGATFIIELPIAKDITEEDVKKEDKSKTQRLF